jgi:hypothetical protein
MRIRHLATLTTAVSLASVLVTPASALAAGNAASVQRGLRTSASAAHIQSVISDMAPLGTAFSTKSAWRQNISSAPLTANSGAMVSNLSGQVARYYGGVAAANISQYNTSVYTVSSTQDRVDVKWDNCQKKTYTPKGLIGEGGQFTQVPIPANAVAASGTDAQLTIYSPQTDQLWEFWKAKKVDGAWQACWGGRIDAVSESHGYFLNGFGASASGLAVSGGAVGIQEAQAGRIEHALTLAIPDIMNYKTFSWPAQRSDGNSTAADAIPTGQRFRLDPSIDIDGLKLHPLAKMIAKAAQTYGFIVTDKSGAVAVSFESGSAVRADTGVDPWTELRKPSPTSKATPTYLIMQNFPWDKLQALPMDYGKPVS